MATIPHLAIHFNRSVNEGNALSVQKDMKPVLGYYSQEEIETFKREGGVVKSIVAAHLGISTVISSNMNFVFILRKKRH